MMKVYIMKDEWYPVYVLTTEEYGIIAVEITEDFKAKYDAAKAAFDEVQTELRNLYSKASGR